MPRVDRSVAIELVASWLTNLSDGRLTARPANSPRHDIEVTDSNTGRTLPLKLAVREFSKSDREGKNFQMRHDVLESDRNGIAILLYLNEGGLQRQGASVKAAWVIPYRSFPGLAGELSARDNYQCRPVHSPAESDQWSLYRCFIERELVDRVVALCKAD